MTADSPIIPPADPTDVTDAVDEDYLFTNLECPHCGYNLTGLREDRCPECGSVFVRALLLAQAAGAPAPIPIWSSRARVGYISATGRTIAAVLFAPERWARRLPAQLDHRERRRFQFTCYALAVVIATAPMMLAPSAATLTVLSVIAAWCLGALVCERLVTDAIFDSDAVTRLGAGTSPQRRRGVGETLCAHALLTAVVLGVANGMYAVAPHAAFVEIWLPLSLSAAVLWWWLAILRSARAIGYSAADVLYAAMIVPVLVCFAVVVAGLCAMVLGFLLMIMAAGVNLGG